MSILTVTLRSTEEVVSDVFTVKILSDQEVLVWEKENGRQAKVKAKFIRRTNDLLILDNDHYEILELSNK